MSVTLEKIAARLRAKTYQNPELNDLAGELATALAEGTRQQGFSRGLHAGVIASQSGGTTLDVGDPAAGRLSKSLQPPQRGLPLGNGALGVRMQANVEIHTQCIPATVRNCNFFTDDNGQRWLRATVTLAAQEPHTGTDPSTGQNIATESPFVLLDDATAPTTDVEVKVDDDQQALAIGTRVNVNMTTQWDVRTIWTNKEGRRIPVVKRTKIVDYTLALGETTTASPIPPTCTVQAIFQWAFLHIFHYDGSPPDGYPGPPPLGVNTVSLVPYQSDGIASRAAGGYWRILEYQPDYIGAPPITDAYPWFGAGRIDINGTLVGLPSIYTDSTDVDWYQSYSTPPAPPTKQYQKAIIVETGCPGEDGNIHWYSGYDQFFSGTSPIADFPP